MLERELVELIDRLFELDLEENQGNVDCFAMAYAKPEENVLIMAGVDRRDPPQIRVFEVTVRALDRVYPVPEWVKERLLDALEVDPELADEMSSVSRSHAPDPLRAS